jgi:hypothetical protein
MLTRTIRQLDREIPALGTRQLLHQPDGLRGKKTNGTAAIVLQPLFSQ